MRTLGIDLAAADKQTAAAIIDWCGSTARVESIESSVSDARLLELIHEADKTGIDVPLGWPEEFIEFITAHQNHEALPPYQRNRLWHRETDRFVYQHSKQRPLSVSADRIGITAMRASVLMATLASRGEVIDRTGQARIVEVYPAAALRVWGFACSGYKGPKCRDALCRLADDLSRRTTSWLDLNSTQERCKKSDHVLDAVIAALVARAATCGLSHSVPHELQARARREGWIALPLPDSLQLLAARR